MAEFSLPFGDLPECLQVEVALRVMRVAAAEQQPHGPGGDDDAGGAAARDEAEEEEETLAGRGRSKRSTLLAFALSCRAAAGSVRIAHRIPGAVDRPLAAAAVDVITALANALCHARPLLTMMGGDHDGQQQQRCCIELIQPAGEQLASVQVSFPAGGEAPFLSYDAVIYIQYGQPLTPGAIHRSLRLDALDEEDWGHDRSAGLATSTRLSTSAHRAPHVLDQAFLDRIDNCAGLDETAAARRRRLAATRALAEVVAAVACAAAAAAQRSVAGRVGAGCGNEGSSVLGLLRQLDEGDDTGPAAAACTAALAVVVQAVVAAGGALVRDVQHYDASGIPLTCPEGGGARAAAAVRVTFVAAACWQDGPVQLDIGHVRGTISHADEAEPRAVVDAAGAWSVPRWFLYVDEATEDEFVAMAPETVRLVAAIAEPVAACVRALAAAALGPLARAAVEARRFVACLDSGGVL